MDKSLIRSLNGAVKLLLDLLITFVVFTMSFVVLLFLGKEIFNVPLKEFISSALYIDNVGAIQYLVVIQSLSLFFFPALAIAWFFSRPRDFFYLKEDVGLKSFVLIIVLMVVAQGVVNILAYWNYNIHFPDALRGLELQLREVEKQAQIITSRILSGTSLGQLIINVIVVALVPAIGEELFFRGVLQRHLKETFRNAHVAIVLTALIFAFAHFEFFTFLPRFLLGLILGYIAYWYKNLWAPILAHFTNNFIGVMIYFVSLRQGKTVDDLTQVQKPAIWLSIASVILLTIILYTLKKWSNGKSQNR